MADFQWEESHIEWFLRKFNNKTEELAARDILAGYKPKRGEPKKGRPKGDEQTIDIQDFRNLMRHMVANKFARVTKGSYKSKNYKIRMVSDEYPYVQEVFDKGLFNHPHMIEPMPEVEVVRNTYLPFLGEWTELHQRLFDKNKQLGYMYVDAFYIYNYKGGDFDLIFDRLPEIDLESPDLLDWKNIFVLHVTWFITVYKAFSIGLPELQEWFKSICVDTPYPDNHNTFFTVIFGHELVKSFLSSLETRDWKVPHQTLSNNTSEIYNYFKQGSSIPKNLISSVERGFNPSDNSRYFIWLGYANKELNALRLSDKLELITAIKEVDTAFSNIMSFWKTRFDRSRNPKRSTNVG